VTNRQFKAFVDGGGYAAQKWWKVPFAKEDKILNWTESMLLFVDSTGHPGPATWVDGTYPTDRAEHPVTGVSWFEAAAYAEFVGKQLPSIYHWHRAHASAHSAFFVPLSNFNSRSSAPVGQYQGMSVLGVHDLAGNAKEWCWNEAETGKRYILGGGWNEPEYMFMDGDARSPFERSVSNGFRCIKIADPAEADKTIDAPLPRRRRDFATEKPVSDAEFEIFRRLYSYDKTSLEPQIDLIDDSNGRWRMEKVSFNAAYNHERMSAFVYLPKNATPPFQTVVFFPNTTALFNRTSEDALLTGSMTSRFVAAGRAVIFPIYQGTFGRGKAPRGWENADGRDWMIQVSKDLSRAIDYLETRKDIQSDKLAYAGDSLGAKLGALLPALEPRLKVSVLVNGGFYWTRPLPEADEFNFAPRVTIPTLMLNGRYDYTFPVETSQLPMFQALGTPLEHKRHVTYETGHNVPSNQISAEITSWLDRYLGPVK
jgi:eukaryotic-like serine/threonine-protein kinase